MAYVIFWNFSFEIKLLFDASQSWFVGRGLDWEKSAFIFSDSNMKETYFYLWCLFFFFF